MKVFIQKESPIVYLNEETVKEFSEDYVEGNLVISDLKHDNIRDMKDEFGNHIKLVAEDMRTAKLPDSTEPIVMDTQLSEVNARHIVIEEDFEVGVEVESPSEDTPNHIVYFNEEINQVQEHGMSSKNFRLEDYVEIRDTIEDAKNWVPEE